MDGRRVLAKVPAEGGSVQRLTANLGSNPTEPDWSPDGKQIAFTSQAGKFFRICVVPAQGGDARILVDGEDPAWGPNSRTLVFNHVVNGRQVLSLLDVPTKQNKDVPQTVGDSSQPSWAK
jgi:Tol biopolymer transport system component